MQYRLRLLLKIVSELNILISNKLFQVYKTQMSRVTDGWHGKIDEFEKINQGLQDSLSKLRDENELLRLKVGSKHYISIKIFSTFLKYHYISIN